MKIAILGFGDEGQSLYRYFEKQHAQITVFDEADQPKYKIPSDVEFIHGSDAFKHIEGFDTVFRGSPAIRPDRFHTDAKRSSLMKEFFQQCPTRRIIGVTGTKGKGTIATLLHNILQAAGKKVHLVGNVGVPALDILSDIQTDDIVVLELSSFQLWDLETSPHIAIVCMIEPEHLEVHKDFAEYVAAKANIAKYQTANDVIIYHPSNEHSYRIAMQSPGRKIKYATPEGAYVQDDVIMLHGQKIVNVADVRVPGAHNLENICAALSAAWEYTQDIAAMEHAVADFTGLEHRLEFVKKVDGVAFYNDSISTTPGSVIAAIRSFDPAHEILIVGGSYDKGADFGDLIDCLVTEKPAHVLFVGPMGEKIAKMADAAGFANGELHNAWQMPQIVARAKILAREDDVVILSPAVASFGDFANYKDRGMQFKEAVQKL